MWFEVLPTFLWVWFELSADMPRYALKIEYDKMINRGDKNIFYIESENALGADYEGTVDGVHFTDLGFKRYADYLMEKLEELKLL